MRSLRPAGIALGARRQSAERPGRKAGKEGGRAGRAGGSAAGGEGVRVPPACMRVRVPRGDRLLLAFCCRAGAPGAGPPLSAGKRRGGRGAAAAGSGDEMSDAETAGAASPVTCATHASLAAGTGPQPSGTAAAAVPPDSLRSGRRR